jgi:hypothetical protein
MKQEMETTPFIPFRDYDQRILPHIHKYYLRLSAAFEKSSGMANPEPRTGTGMGVYR